MARALGRTAAGVGATLAGLAVLLSASGWLYLIRPHDGIPFAGPPIGDALPLDELSKHSAVSLSVFALVWGVAALLLALIARAVRIERLTAALLLALLVGLWGYLETGTSLLIVRQVPAHEAFAAASRLQSVLIPAALAGFAAALLAVGRPRSRPRAPMALAWFVAAAGVLDVLDGITPEHGQGFVEQYAPSAVHPYAAALVAPTGIVLLLLARGLARRKRRAWQLATALLCASAALDAFHGFNHGAVAAVLVAIALVARRHDFDGRGDPEAHPRVLARAAFFLALVYAYGAAALWVNRLTADQPYTLGFAFRETSLALVGAHVRGSAHLVGSFGDWFPLSVLILGLAGIVSLLSVWLAPWRHRVRQEARERELARDLVSAFGEDTLAPFVLRGDKSYFFSPDERAFLAYRVVGGVAVVSGDPIGAHDAFAPLVASFVRFAHLRDWRIAILGASERCLGLYREHGLHALYHGDEAVLDVASFSLEGRAIRKVRQSVHRLEKAGYAARALRPAELGPDLRAELEEVARAWRGGEPNRGYAMALDTLFRLEDEALFVAAFDAEGRVRGFLHFAVCERAHALSLSSMPRFRDTPNGLNEWLVCETVEWARGHGFERISLNFAPFAALLAPGAELTATGKLQRRALLGLKGHFQLDNLLLFNRKFFPRWQPRFVVYERRRDLPRVSVAALAAEAYLPWGGRERLS